MSRITAAAFRRAMRKKCLCRSCTPRRTKPGSGSGCQSPGAASKQIREFSAFATNPAQGVSSPLTCLATQCRKFCPHLARHSPSGKSSRRLLQRDLAEHTAQLVKIHRFAQMEIEPRFLTPPDILACAKSGEGYAFD